MFLLIKKESDNASEKRLGKLEIKLAGLEARSQKYTSQWESEKAHLADSTKAKEELGWNPTEDIKDYILDIVK